MNHAVPSTSLQHLASSNPATASPFIAPTRSSLTSSNTLWLLRCVAALTIARARFWALHSKQAEQFATVVATGSVIIAVIVVGVGRHFRLVVVFHIFQCTDPHVDSPKVVGQSIH